MHTKFKVCVGVRSGPKGPVIDLSIVGLESLSKQNLGFALGYVQSQPKGPVIDSSICGRGSRSTWKYVQAFDGLEAPMLVQTKFEVCVGYVLGRRAPAMDFSTFGLESLFKQNLKLALAYILGRRACH